MDLRGWAGAGSARLPGAVPDLVGVPGGADTDGDGVPDTALAVDGADLLVRTDLGGDGLVDRVLRIGLDAAVHVEVPPADGPVPGSAPAGWPGLLGEFLGPGP